MHSLLPVICLLFLFEQTGSINYQFISCLQHVFICVAYWERGKLLPEASDLRTGRRSSGRSWQRAGPVCLWMVVVAGGNSKPLVPAVELRFISATLRLLCCSPRCPVRTVVTERKRIQHLNILPVPCRKLAELKHISVVMYGESEHRCAPWAWLPPAAHAHPQQVLEATWTEPCWQWGGKGQDSVSVVVWVSVWGFVRSVYVSLWYVFCIAVELHLWGLSWLWSRFQWLSLTVRWGNNYILLRCYPRSLVCSEAPLGALFWNSSVSTSSFTAKVELSSLSAVCTKSTWSDDASYWCLWNSAKERIKIIPSQNGEGRGLRESKECHSWVRQPPALHHAASWHVLLLLLSTMTEHSSILNSAVLLVSAS